MGDIYFNPTESQIVKNLLEKELSKIQRTNATETQKQYACDLLEYSVNTNTTPRLFLGLFLGTG